MVFCGLLEVACAVFLLEPFYSTGSIDIFLLARIERMAHRAYLCVDFFCRTAGLECIATAAVDHHFIVLWMYIFFHNYSVLHPEKIGTTKDKSVPEYFKTKILTRLMHISTENFLLLAVRISQKLKLADLALEICLKKFAGSSYIILGHITVSTYK